MQYMPPAGGAFSPSQASEADSFEVFHVKRALAANGASGKPRHMFSEVCIFFSDRLLSRFLHYVQLPGCMCNAFLRCPNQSFRTARWGKGAGKRTGKKCKSSCSAHGCSQRQTAPRGMCSASWRAPLHHSANAKHIHRAHGRACSRLQYAAGRRVVRCDGCSS
jgi:hypothetical protein